MESRTDSREIKKDSVSIVCVQRDAVPISLYGYMGQRGETVPVFTLRQEEEQEGYQNLVFRYRTTRSIFHPGAHRHNDWVQ